MSRQKAGHLRNDNFLAEFRRYAPLPGAGNQASHWRDRMAHLSRACAELTETMGLAEARMRMATRLCSEIDERLHALMAGLAGDARPCRWLYRVGGSTLKEQSEARDSPCQIIIGVIPSHI